MDLVLQGPIWTQTYSIAESYLNLDFVDNVIISTWIDQNIQSNNTRIKIIKSEYPYNEGYSNMNLQIVSSLNGLRHVTSNRTAKMRSDQLVSSDSMKMLYKFSIDNDGIDDKFSDGSGPEGPIFVVGMQKIFVYHPQDHIYWGHTKDLLTMFDIPLLTEDNMPVLGDHWSMRAPGYLGANYFAKFRPIVYYHIKDFKNYLSDLAPKKEDAMEIYTELRDKIYKVFPRFDMMWFKYNSGYWYNDYHKQGEYYYEDLLNG